MTEKDLQQAVRRHFHNHEYILVNSFVFDWESDFFSVTKSGNVYEVEMKVTRADFRKDFEKDKHLLFRSNSEGRSHHITRSSGVYNRDKERLICTYKEPGITWRHPEGYYRDYRTWDYVTGYGEARISPRKVEVWAPCTAIRIRPVGDLLCPNRFYYACPPGIIPQEELPGYAGLIHVTDGGAKMIKQAPFLHKRPLLEGKLTGMLLSKFWYLSQAMRWELIRHNINFKDCSEGAKTEE